MKFVPKNNFIVLDWKKEEESSTDWGLVIKSTVSKRGDVAEVLAINSTCTDISVGDKVLFNKLAGSFSVIEGQEVLIVKESDVYAIVD